MSDKGWVISKNDYRPDLEDRVAHYVQTVPRLPINTRKPVRARQPDSSDPLEQDMWCREELRRIKQGHFGMSGKMYFWYNYVKMGDEVEGGILRPEYRVCQSAWFENIKAWQDSKEWGGICVKRRRIGASWLEASDVLHDAITRPHTKYGMTSKTEGDAIKLFEKVKFIYNNLPEWMRPRTTAGNSRMYMNFAWKGKDSKGNTIVGGTQSAIQVKAPTDTAWEGFAMSKFIVDEAGKISNLKRMYSLTEPVMMKGTRRVGTPLIFGTAGDITKEGADFKDMFHNAEAYKLKQFFFGGWMGLDGLVDEFGNDLVEEAIRWVVYERARKESLAKSEYVDFIQQYPLTVGEAFTSNENYGVGNSFKISKRIDDLYSNPVAQKRGHFKLEGLKPIFTPHPRGACIIYEEPDPGMDGLYIGGLDSTDHEVKNPNANEVSGHAMFIVKKRKGLDPPKIVFELYDKPNLPRDFWDQSLLACLYYNQAKVLVERNKPGVITYFDESGFKHLLATKPGSFDRLVNNNTWNIGLHVNDRIKRYGEECISEYIEDYSDHIPSQKLLEECLSYGQRNTDRVAAFAMAMIYLKEDKWEATPKLDNDRFFQKRLIIGPNGIPIRV